MKNIEIEKWLEIPEFQGYQISNIGRVKSLQSKGYLWRVSN